jgi:putative mRNA 3-end processing factor
MDLLESRPEGIYCRAGDFFIDPSKSVKQALITHGHSDHARRGSEKYLTQQSGVNVLKERLGMNCPVQGIPYGKKIKIGETWVSFHPAGHILGSAQIRIESSKEVWVFSGDYKTQVDRTCPGFETIPCDVFVTESTFALPIYHWAEEEQLNENIRSIWAKNQNLQITTIIYAYSLGKTQRILAGLDTPLGKIFLDEPSFHMTQVYEKSGIQFPKYQSMREFLKKESPAPLLVLTPSKNLSPWADQIGEYRSYMASGWLRVNPANAFDENVIVMSDHADWQGLNESVKGTGAERIIVMHGFTDSWIRYLNENGYKAQTFSGKNFDANNSNIP